MAIDSSGFGLTDARGVSIDPAVLEDQLLIREVKAPRFAAPNSTVEIEVTVEGKAPAGTDAEGILEFIDAAGGQTVRIPPESGNFQISDGVRQTKRATFTMPEGTLEVDIRALEHDVDGNKVTDTAKVTVSSTGSGGTGSAGLLNVAFEWGPWLVGGAGVGAGVAGITDRPPVTGAGVGAGAGIGAKVLLARQQGPIVPEFPMEAVLATAGLFAAGAIFFQVSGIGGITQGIGGVAGGIGEAAGRLRRA